jgi:hypothetical protein
MRDGKVFGVSLLHAHHNQLVRRVALGLIAGKVAVENQTLARGTAVSKPNHNTEQGKRTRESLGQLA